MNQRQIVSAGSCVILGLGLLGSAGCGNKEPLASQTGNTYRAGPKQGPAQTDAQGGRRVASGKDGSQADPQSSETERTGLWTLDKSATRMVFDKELPGASPADIVREVNARYPSPRMVLNKVSQHTAVVQVKDDEKLTQEMGSTGAQSYLAIATYSLTSVPGIEDVQFQFTAGDHASPGTYRRRDFADMFR